MEQIFSQLFYEVEKHRDTVLVTLIADRGSAPRKAGAQMLVGAEGRLVGTIGGGAVEGRSIQLSQQLLAQRRSCIREFPLHQAPERDIGMVCGGDVTAHFQFIPAEDPTWSETASRALALLNRHTAGWLVLAEDGSAPALLDRESVVSGSLPEDTAQALRTPGFSMAAGYISLPLPIGQRALLFGAGHISQALCPLLNTIGFRPVVFDDRPELARFIPEEEARSHYLSSAQGIFDMLHHAEIHFTQPDEVVLAAIQILYLSIIHINRIGPNFFPALRLLVVGACEELVA